MNDLHGIILVAAFLLLRVIPHNLVIAIIIMSNNQVTLSGPDGSSAAVTLFGAHVISFKSE